MTNIYHHSMDDMPLVAYTHLLCLCASQDLKSPNVLLSEEGVAKVADVGMSRAQVSMGD